MRTPSPYLLAGQVGAGLAASAGLRLADRFQSRPYDVDYVPSGKVLRLVTLGHRLAVSDLYWLSTVQYVGEPKAAERGWDQLYPLVDLVTDLDPRHGYAYQTAGIVLSAAGRIDESDRILQKGIDQGPPWWSFPYYLAFNHWYYLGDYANGARYAALAATRPGASENVRRLALALSSKSGRPEDALALLLEMRETVKDEKTAASLDDQIKLAMVERDAQALEQAAARQEAERGWPIADLQELVVGGYVKEIPPDPFGGRYVWHRDEKRVRSSVNPFRFTVREDRHRPGFFYEAKPKQEGPP
jgi:tetratricopeptide (TPR) repeat protein